MNASLFRHSKTAAPPLRGARCALALCGFMVALIASPAWPADGDAPNDVRARSEERRRAWQQMPPEQRRELWQSLSPEQRELLMRRVPNDERRQMWQQMTPEQKNAMRQRFTEQGGQGRSKLTPEERQRLRDQIRDAQKDWKKAPAQR